MADDTKIAADGSAEKAYAAAAQSATAKPAAAEAAKPVPVIEVVKPEVEFPSRETRATKPKSDAPVVAAPVAPAPVKLAPAAKAQAKKAVKKAKVVPAKAPAVLRKPKPDAVKPAVAVKPKILASTAKAAIQPKAAPKTATLKKTVFQQLKDKTMDTTQFTTKLKGTVSEVQAKAKESFDKGAATFGEYNEFAKGNLEAVVESGKILAAGVQTLGSAAVADTKANFETLTAEVKELARVKSPLDFFKLQVAFARRNFDLAVAQTSKNSEAVLKLVNEVAAPISGRVNLAVEKVKQAA